ncbi:hypothetical protein BCR36DRAFT_580538 [Piromyces finnis]|uniref:PHD-type domain-containing protein n=1 Tax=Piromyces finnis TaxID=1754191 RepID=A0A1Y1VIH2_9FUNG|nr:hypothetical protein BCR36DRAFT_580538 [Piromyces finnis]|eukprot:ORX57128.1 hypothetical protein BCR36DRAFT_580538 [Piromyces finnis]
MVNKRTLDSDKQKNKKQKTDNETNIQESEKPNKSEIEVKPKRSARLRNRSKTNSVSSVENNLNNTDNIINNSVSTGDKSISSGVNNESKTLNNTEEEKLNSKISSPNVGTRAKNIRKTKKVDNEMSSSAPSTPTGRSRKSSVKTEDVSEQSLIKSPKAKPKTKRTRGRRSTKSEEYIVEEPESDGGSVTTIDPVEKEIKRKSQSIVVEIEQHKELNLMKSSSNLLTSSEVSKQDTETSNILSNQTISSIDVNDTDNNENINQQLINQEPVKKENIEINSGETPKQFTIDIKPNVEANELLSKSNENSTNDKNNNNVISSTTNNSTNSTTKNTASSNHYNSRLHSKRKKKITLKKSDLSGRSIHIPAGLVNPFKEKSHHQKVDESIKEDMLIIRECIQQKSETTNKEAPEKQDIGTKKNPHGTRRSLRRTSLANSNQSHGTNVNSVTSPKARYSSEQLTKLNSYNQGVLPFYALDDVSKTEVNDDYCSTCHQSTGCFLCCDSCPKSFHFDCVNPPLDKSNIPEGIWECKECRAKKDPDLLKNDSNEKDYWKVLLKNLDRHNPRNFELPDWLVNEYENIIKNPVTGDYLDVSQWKSVRISRNGTISHSSQNDNSLKTIPICYKCGEGISKDHLVQCDYCDLSWHLDCLDPPLSSNPNTNVILIGNANSNGIITKHNNNSSNHDNNSEHIHSKENVVIENHRIYGMKRKWMCPCHADWEMPKKRHKKSVIEVDIENLSEADFEKIDEFEAERVGSDDELSNNSHAKSNNINNSNDISTNNINNSTIDIKKESNDKVIDLCDDVDIKKEDSEEPVINHYSDNTKEIKRGISKSYVELDKTNFNPVAVQNEFIEHVQNLKSSLRSYNKKVMELPDQPIVYHSNIHNLYSNNESDKELIPNIPEQDIEDWLSTVSSLQQDIAKELNYRKSFKKFWDNIRIERLPDPPYDACTKNKQYEKDQINKLEILCKTALDAPYNQYVNSNNITQLLDSKILFNDDKTIKERIMNETDEITEEQSNNKADKDSSSEIISKDDPLFKQFLTWRKLCKTILNPSSINNI